VNPVARGLQDKRAEKGDAKRKIRKNFWVKTSRKLRNFLRLQIRVARIYAQYSRSLSLARPGTFIKSRVLASPGHWGIATKLVAQPVIITAKVPSRSDRLNQKRKRI